VPNISATKPIQPARFASAGCTSHAVATMAKSRSIEPPSKPMPLKKATSAKPLAPPVTLPPT
jgi:hypothetical protein